MRRGLSAAVGGLLATASLVAAGPAAAEGWQYTQPDQPPAWGTPPPVPAPVQPCCVAAPYPYAGYAGVPLPVYPGNGYPLPYLGRVFVDPGDGEPVTVQELGRRARREAAEQRRAAEEARRDGAR